jgi:hypothetical protein
MTRFNHAAVRTGDSNWTRALILEGMGELLRSADGDSNWTRALPR